jgi:hypothetical protein
MSNESEPIDDYVVVNTSEIRESEMDETVDVSIEKDGGVLKHILRTAPEDARGPPPKGYVVTVHYVVRASSSYLFLMLLTSYTLFTGSVSVS